MQRQENTKECLLMQGHGREEEAGETSCGQIVDAFICLAMNFILLTN